MEIFDDCPLGPIKQKENVETDIGSPSDYYSPKWRDSLEILPSRHIRRNLAVELKYRIDEEEMQDDLNYSHGLSETKKLIEDWRNEAIQDDSDSDDEYIGSESEEVEFESDSDDWEIEEPSHMDLEDNDFAERVKFEDSTKELAPKSIARTQSKTKIIASMLSGLVIKRLEEPCKPLSCRFINNIMTRLSIRARGK